MSNNLKNFLKFKIEQFCRINGIEETKESIAKVITENKTSFLKEAIAAGITA